MYEIECELFHNLSGIWTQVQTQIRVQAKVVFA